MMLDFPHIVAAAPWRGAWALVLSLAVGLGAAPVQAQNAALPMRNLLVEWRLNGQDHSREHSAGVQQGRVIIDSRRGVVGQGDVRLGAWRTESTTHSVQQVQVLNGGRARLFVGSSQPYTVWQWSHATAPRARHDGRGASGQAWTHTEWWELGQGLDVRPSWPGGQSPVTVELEASDSGRPAYEPDGQVRRSEVASTLSVPLGEWAEVARSGSRTQQSRSGTWSTDSIDSQRADRLEIRITAP